MNYDILMLLGEEEALIKLFVLWEGEGGLLQSHIGVASLGPIALLREGAVMLIAARPDRALVIHPIESHFVDRGLFRILQVGRAHVSALQALAILLDHCKPVTQLPHLHILPLYFVAHLLLLCLYVPLEALLFRLMLATPKVFIVTLS